MTDKGKTGGGMTCPYAVSSRNVTQTQYEYNEDGGVVFTQVVEISETQFVPCTRERCGAWTHTYEGGNETAGYCAYGGNT